MSVEVFLTTTLEPLFSNRLYRMRLPIEAVLPAGTYQRIDTEPKYTHDGDAHLPTARFQIDCWAADPDAADDVADLVRAALSGYSDDTYQSIFLADERELDEPDVGIYRRSIDFFITYANGQAS
jgi:hypothetical protein